MVLQCMLRCRASGYPQPEIVKLGKKGRKKVPLLDTSDMPYTDIQISTVVSTQAFRDDQKIHPRTFPPHYFDDKG